SSVLTVVCNLIFAPICIFVFEWGMRGAAIATIASQAVGLVWVLCHFLNRHTFIRFHRASLHLRKRLIKNIFSIGMSPFFMNVCACLVTIFINNRLLTYGNDYSVGAFGIANRMQMLFVMVVLGIAQGMQPIVGYNYGASQYDRVRRALRYGIIAGVAVTTTGCILGTGFPSVFVGMFTDDPMLVPQSEFALRIAVLMFPFVGAQIITCQFFQSIGKAKAALFLSLSRQLVFLLPGIALLPLFFDVDGVWYSMPVSDFLATILAIWLLARAHV
ncbi:MAG: MATE family efflux transporter, partial [Bacteroidales bacterium]|nr:MATE family efflux transporter [Bacteroidales bacterium]